MLDCGAGGVLRRSGRELSSSAPAAFAGSAAFVSDQVAFVEQPATPVTGAAYRARPT